MRHRDVSEWGQDLIDYAKACWQAVTCEEHVNCLRDETDEEICVRLREKIIAEQKAAMEFRGIVSLDGKVVQ